MWPRSVPGEGHPAYAAPDRRGRLPSAMARRPVLPELADPRAEHVVEGSAFHTLDEAAAEFTRALALTSPWEGSLDALNDVLYGGFGTPAGGFVLVWRDSDLSRERLGYPATTAWLEARVRRGPPYDVALLSGRLEAARRGEGQTLFDVVVEIIRDHPEIELRLE